MRTQLKGIRAKILSNENIALGYFKMLLEAPFIAERAKPGQFVHVRCNDTLDPLLRRPFSVHRVKSQETRDRAIEILYEVVGRGTEVLSKKKKGDSLDILGPLGNGFTLPHAEQSTILIAGGIGVAPLVFLAEKLMETKNNKVIVLLGAKTKKLILCEKDFKKIGAKVYIATDDGTRGCKGFVSRLLDKILREINEERRMMIYACGPQSMLKCIAEISEGYDIPCEVSLEEKMACGFGACLGCSVRLKDSASKEGFTYKLACKDGPIFKTNQIIWSKT